MIINNDAGRPYKRVNPDGSVTIGILEDEPKVEAPKAEPVAKPKPAPKAAPKKKTAPKKGK